VNFLILGSLEVRSNNKIIPITAPKLRAALVTLLLDANNFVAIDQLTDYVWDGQPPGASRAALQTYMYRLRRYLSVLPDVRLDTKAAGYTLNVDANGIDANRFRQRVDSARELVRGGNPSEAIQELRKGLSIWRGRALADIHGERLQQEAQFIDGERLAAHEELLSLEVAVGHHQRVIPELVKLSVAHPFRETLTAQLMLALYRSGLQVEALQRYSLTRRRLREELGIEPGAELQQLQRAILGRRPAEEIQLSRG
jgi:DNA-binding SARP family transcriptional activator